MATYPNQTTMEDEPITGTQSGDQPAEEGLDDMMEAVLSYHAPDKHKEAFANFKRLNELTGCSLVDVQMAEDEFAMTLRFEERYSNVVAAYLDAYAEKYEGRVTWEPVGFEAPTKEGLFVGGEAEQPVAEVSADSPFSSWGRRVREMLR